jgi:hypothetical protein
MAILSYKWLMTGLLALLHPFFIGVTEVQHNAVDKTLEISVKLFAEDLEKTIVKVNHQQIDIGNTKDSAKANQLIAAYIKQHLLLNVDGKAVQLQWVGFENEREAIWCFLQVGNIPNAQKITIDNSLLYEAFEQQINLMHVTVNGVRKSNKLEFPQQKAEFIF